MPKKKNDEPQDTADNSTPQPLMPALPPPDDPLRRSTEFDPDREYKSREMAEKRLAAIRKTRKMPTANEESAAQEGHETDADAKSDST
jgi:hypothetical protein